MKPSADRKRVLIAMAIAIVLLAVGLTLLLLWPASAGDSQDRHSNTAWIALVPLYISLIPIFVSTARRRKNKQNDG